VFQPNWSIICGRAIFDAVTQSVSLIDVIDQVKVPPIPEGEAVTLPLQPTMVTEWRFDEAAQKPEFKIRLIDPDGNAVNESPPFSVLRHPGDRTKTLTTLPPLEFRKLGIYRYVISSRGLDSEAFEDVATVPLNAVSQDVGQRFVVPRPSLRPS
jgi:hypothetical protein